MCFPLPLPACCREPGKREREVVVVRCGAVERARGYGVSPTPQNPGCWGCRYAADETVTVCGFGNDAGGGHGGETLVEGGGADAADGAQIRERPGLLAVGKGCGDALIQGSRCHAALRQAVGSDRFEGESGHGGGGAMLDGQDDAVVTIAPQIEIGVAPGVELRRAAQGLAGADVARAFLGMMDDGDGERVAALEFAQEGEQRCALAAVVFVDAMQPDERVEDEQPRLQCGHGLVETGAV